MTHEERLRLIYAPFPTVHVHTCSRRWAGALIEWPPFYLQLAEDAPVNPDDPDVGVLVSEDQIDALIELYRIDGFEIDGTDKGYETDWNHKEDR